MHFCNCQIPSLFRINFGNFTHFIFINDNSVDNTICNMNLCKHNDRIPTEYDN